MIANTVMAAAIGAAERGLVPDTVVRAGIRALCRRRLREIRDPSFDDRWERTLRDGPVALHPKAANEQHYEVPATFFARMLGPHRKYSCCCWEDGAATLEAAEACALEVTCRRAGLHDGMRVLELGCGWGSLTLWMAARFPASSVVAVSNSASQRRFIEAAAAKRGLDNITVQTVDMNEFAPTGRFDRVVSVEMFEHMRNYAELLRRIAGWLEPDGRLFVHLFGHRTSAYPFATDGPANWMGRTFFTGGLMPSADLLRRFDEHLRVTDEWWWDGTHYQRTAEAWLENLDAQRAAVLPILAEVYGPDQARRWLHRWRIFLLACAELFGYEQGSQWGVAHCLLEPVATQSPVRTPAATAHLV